MAEMEVEEEEAVVYDYLREHSVGRILMATSLQGCFKRTSHGG